MAIERPTEELSRISTGVPALDVVLGGGIPKCSVVFVAGLPGTGKTILCEQAIWTNARKADRVLYLSTLSEPMLKMLRFTQQFDFFASGMVGREVVYGDLGGALARGGPQAVLDELGRLVAEHRPELLVIDSFKVLRESVPDALAFRVFASELMLRLSAWEVTSLFVGEYTEEDIRSEAEFAIADGIIYLYGTEEGGLQKRLLRIMKMRGTDYFAGEHVFEIGAGGITLYPRMNPRIIGEYAVSHERTPSAIGGLTEMLGGGMFGATSTLIVGVSGAGKTLTALSFLVEAGRAGKRCLYVSFEESALQITRNSEAFGWDVAALAESGLLHFVHVSPSELDIDIHANAIKETAVNVGAEVVVIDSISGFEAISSDQRKYQSYLWAINDYFKRTGVSLIMTAESNGFFETGEFVPKHISLFVDTIILLRATEIYGEAKRIISVPKMRGSVHDHFARAFVVTPSHVAIGEVVELNSRHGVDTNGQR